MSIVSLIAFGRESINPPWRAVMAAALLFAPAYAQFTEQGPQLIGTGTVGYSQQGTSVALSGDGKTVLVGGPADNNFIGAVWIFTINGGVWTQQGSKLSAGGIFEGQYVALSGDGNTALSGGGPSGGAWIYSRSGSAWTKQAALNSGAGITTGVTLSSDGNTALVGNHNGAVIWNRSGSAWTQGQQLAGSGAVAAGSNTGFSVALSGDGKTAILGVQNDQKDNGGAWVFVKNGGVWSQQGAELVGTGSVLNAGQGNSVALSSDGSTALVGGPHDNNLAGAAWVFTRSGGVWAQQGSKLVMSGTTNLGFSVALSGTGNRAVVGSVGSGGVAWTRTGSTWNRLGPPLLGAGAVAITFEGISVSLSQDGNTAATGGPINGGIGSSWVFTQIPEVPLHFVAVTPCRIADTRNPDGPFGGPQMAGGMIRDFAIPNSACGIPSTAQAYSLNVTVVPDGPLGYLTVWPTGQEQPVVSTMNSYDGRVKANAAITPAGTGGSISVYVTNNTDVILDIDGYFVPDTALEFYPLTPCRIADTRNPAGPLGGPSLAARSTRDFPIRSACNIPAGALAYSLNFTAVPHGFLGYLTTWPAGDVQPVVSTLNSYTGAVTANAAIIEAGTNGDIDVYVTDSADLVIDINGYFAAAGTGGQSLYNFVPCRVLDTRLQGNVGAFQGVLDVNVTGSACGVTNTAQAYVFNATVVPSGPLGYLTLWPQGQAQPVVSTLNAVDGEVTSNMAIVPTGNGSVNAYTTNPTQLLLDISSYFAP